VIDMMVTKRRDRRAAKSLFRKMLKHQGPTPRQLITDKLRSYPAAPSPDYAYILYCISEITRPDCVAGRASRNAVRPALSALRDENLCIIRARDIFPSVVHRTGQYGNNRAEVSHQHTREQERQMRRFKSMAQTQRFLSVHGPIQNLFRVDRYHLKAVHHRLLRARAFSDWREVICVC